MNKPPILSNDRINEILYPEWRNEGVEPSYRDIAEAQRDADLTWLCEEVEQMVIPYMRGSYYYSGAEGFKQQVLALLRGTRKEGED